MLLDTIRHNARARIKGLGLPMQTLSVRADKPERWLSEALSPRRAPHQMSTTQLEELARVLGMSVEYLVRSWE